VARPATPSHASEPDSNECSNRVCTCADDHYLQPALWHVDVDSEGKEEDCCIVIPSSLPEALLAAQVASHGQMAGIR
jgi:hypothetical protein